MKQRYTILFILLFSISHAQTPVKKVLMEEFTTVLCGVCPPVTYNVNQYHNNTPNAILVTIHEGFGNDSMSNATTDQIYNAFKPTWGSFAPAIMVDRRLYPSIDSLYPYLSVGGFDTLVDNALTEPGFVELVISSQYLWGSGSVMSTVTATFYDPLPAADYRVNLFLVEDSVIGYGYPGYAQKCYDANWVATHYPGYPYANDTISGYPHRYVLRQSLTGNAFGSSQTSPVLQSNQSPSLLVPYTYTMPIPFVIPATYNFDRLYLVASVNRYEPGSYSGNFVINAERVKLTDNISTGISLSGFATSAEVFPNPVTDQVTVSFFSNTNEEVSLFINDVTGKTIFQKKVEIIQAGFNKITFDPGKLTGGIYLLEIRGSEKSWFAKLIAG